MAQPTTNDNPAWTDDDLSHNPHEAGDKASRVRRMFAAIAPSYDLNNRLHSMGRDQAWRRAAVKMAGLKQGDRVVDIACGTGDLTIAYRNALSAMAANSGEPMSNVIGIDFTFEMLHEAVPKGTEHPGWDERVGPGDNGAAGLFYINADAMALPLPDACCDVVSIAFGIRNVADPAKAMAEFYRVLKPGGRVIVLEFSLPKNPVLLAGYNFYFKHVMPRTATLISGDKSGAYKYLPKSVNTFIDREQMQQMMRDAGLTDIVARPLTFGIAVCYRGVKTV